MLPLEFQQHSFPWSSISGSLEFEENLYGSPVKVALQFRKKVLSSNSTSLVPTIVPVEFQHLMFYVNIYCYFCLVQVEVPKSSNRMSPEFIISLKFQQRFSGVPKASQKFLWNSNRTSSRLPSKVSLECFLWSST